MKKYVPNKYIVYLYFTVPLIINATLNYSSNEDIWYIMRYGKVILENGFIHTDVLSIHSGLHIVIQQSFTNVLFYLIYNYLGDFGFFLLCELMVGLYLFIIYKICMLLSNKNKLLSILISTITCTLLEINYITPRPQIFTFLNILLIMYILEVFYKNNKTKIIYFLPLISLLQMNFHGALWYFIFIFMLPYIAQMILEKNKNVFIILLLMIIMFLVGFINPYTYENVFFPFKTYDPIINKYIAELFPINISPSMNNIFPISLFFCIVFAVVLLIYIYYKKGKLELRHLFLLGGTTILALINVRSISLFIIGSLPPLANYLKSVKLKLRNDYIDTKTAWIFMTILIIIIAAFNTYRLESGVKKGGNYLDKHYPKDIIVYTNLDYGSYIEYLGFHSYFDTRAEVFTKKANKKKEIFREAMEIEYLCTNYKDFIEKYKFTHLIVYKKTCLYKNLKKDKTKIIFNDKKYTIFEIDRKE